MKLNGAGAGETSALPTSLITPQVYKNATVNQGYFYGSISSSPASQPGYTYGVMYPQTQTGTLCQFSVAGSWGLGNTISADNCNGWTPLSPSASQISDPLAAISAMDVNGDMSTELFMAGFDNNIYLYDMVNGKIVQTYSNAFEFPDNSNIIVEGNLFKPGSSYTAWASMEALYDRENNDIILILAANKTVDLLSVGGGVHVEGGLFSQPVVCAAKLYSGVTNLYYYIYDLDTKTLVKQFMIPIDLLPILAGEGNCSTVYEESTGYIGTFVTKNHASSPFTADGQPSITLTALYNKADSAEVKESTNEQDAINALSGNVSTSVHRYSQTFTYANATEVTGYYHPFGVSPDDFSNSVSMSDFQGCVTLGGGNCAGYTAGNQYSGSYDVMVVPDGNLHTIVWPSKLLAMIDAPICNTTDQNVSCTQSLYQETEHSSTLTASAGHAYMAGMSMDFTVKAEGDGFTAGLDTDISVGSDTDESKMQSASSAVTYQIGGQEPPNVILQGFSATVQPAKVVYSMNDHYKVGQYIYATTARHFGIEECAITNKDCTNQYFNLEQIYNDVIGHNYNQNDSTSYLDPPSTFNANPQVSPLISYYNIGAQIVGDAAGYEIEASVAKGQDKSSSESSESSVSGFFGVIAGVETAALGFTFSAETTFKESAGYKVSYTKGWGTGFTDTIASKSSVTCNGCTSSFPGLEGQAPALATVLYTYTYDLGNLNTGDVKGGNFCVTAVPPHSTTGEEETICEKQTFIVSSTYLCTGANADKDYCQQ